MARMNISVPDDLKRRMDAVKDVSWSPLACRAFEAKLAEITTKRRTEDMGDIIARLRESKRDSGDEATRRGHAAGRAWARYHAEAEQLERLGSWVEGAGTGPDWRDQLEGGYSDASPDHILACEALGRRPDQADYEGFWAVAIGDATPEDRVRPSFAVAFVEGAMEVWEQVEGQL